MTDLNATDPEPLEVSLVHDGSGNFTLFLFNQRPSGSNLNSDNTLNSNIFNNPPTVAYSLDDNPDINYTAPEDKIYYIEVILVSGGPDTFTLTANKDLTRYYLPLIPGFHIGFLLISIICALGVIFLLHRKKISK
ncbi:MAG: Loki-CTERM sorting domain-containing protein [Promethearchaeota archaeon]